MNEEDQSFLEHSLPPSAPIAESIAQIKAFALQEFDREIVQKQLYYHTREHIENVQRRANAIFQAIRPCWLDALNQTQPGLDLSRTKLLLDLCVAAHDMVQVFLPQPQTHATRQREAGVSERATIERLLAYIHKLNQQLQAHTLEGLLTDDDIRVIRESIATTICAYDPIERAIYQPNLYDSDLVPLVARILALADIGALGIDGVQVYNQEGTLLFLEENLDLMPLLSTGKIDRLVTDDPDLSENLRQRLLKRSRFQVNFAKSRIVRFEPELSGFPQQAIDTLKREVFRYLTPATIQEVEATTPTDETTSLPKLLEFFEFERYLKRSENFRMTATDF